MCSKQGCEVPTKGRPWAEGCSPGFPARIHKRGLIPKEVKKRGQKVSGMQAGYSETQYTSRSKGKDGMKGK